MNPKLLERLVIMTIGLLFAIFGSAILLNPQFVIIWVDLIGVVLILVGCALIAKGAGFLK